MEDLDLITLKEKMIRDPVHNYIWVTPVERAIIDTPWMQRLHGIKHMATTNKTYISANSTRFEHSLGTMHVAGRILDTLDEKGKIDKIIITARESNFDKNLKLKFFGAGPVNLKKEEIEELKEIKARLKQTIRLIALVHDIGHGPFSHSSEHLLQYGNSYDKYEKDPEYDFHNHEIVALELMLDYLPKGVDELLKISYIKDDGITSKALMKAKELFLNKELIKALFVPNYEKKDLESNFLLALSMILNSQLDADKLDYLHRDTYVTGSEFGKIVDLDRIIHSLTIDNENFLCLEKRALSAAESLIEARYMISRYLYHHHTVCLTDEMLKRALNHAIDGGIFGEEYPFSSKKFGEIKVHDDEVFYGCLDDACVIQRIREADPSKASNEKLKAHVIKARFYLKNLESRNLHKPLWKISTPPVMVEEVLFQNNRSWNFWKIQWIDHMYKKIQYLKEDAVDSFRLQARILANEMVKKSNLTRLGVHIDFVGGELVDSNILEKLKSKGISDIEWKDIISTKKKFTPYTSPLVQDKRKRINIQHINEKSIDIDQVSPLIEGLNITWSLHHWAHGTFVYLSKKVISDENIRKKSVESIKELLEEAVVPVPPT